MSASPTQPDEAGEPPLCDATFGGERACIKPMYRARNGELWPHAGGHFFATEIQAERLRSGDYDATEVLRSMRRVGP